MQTVDWMDGDSLGLAFPAHPQALIDAGPAFLTRAFRAAETIAADNSVAEIVRCQSIEGGSTGRKLLLDIAYSNPSPTLHTELFVKFSRDFSDARRDAARVQMEREVLFALLSLQPDFPITVPACYFADYHRESGTGILVTQRVPFGDHGLEPHYAKCLDHRMPDPPAHYRALIRALARLAGTHRARHFPERVESDFSFDPASLAVSQRAPYSPEQISERVALYADFAERYPAVLPANLRAAGFLQRLAEEAPRFQALVPVARRVLQSQPEMIALCHWNAHVDNAWFWRNGRNELECGLMDWGNVSQMNVAMAIWGCLSAAEPALWSNHLDELLTLFVEEFAASGGPHIDLETLRRHLTLYVATMGLAWMLDAPALILAHADQLELATDRLDRRIQDSERARSQLLIMIAFLNLWEQQDMRAVIDDLAALA